MVWSQESEAERPPLSVILPQLYLGAERDVTQECLSSLGISYVLSVSRCSPQPSFLPASRFLRIPIDDSLWADLLPWIPQALHFIDAAMSSGASVLVHCAAGISRSPALAVAYVMYRLDLDLDRAYRFVKERRPTISPNFNFLGQLQHFQATLSQRAPRGGFFIQGQDERVAWPPCDEADPLSDRVDPPSDRVDPPSDRADPPHSNSEDSERLSEKPQQRLLFTDVNGNQQQNFVDVNQRSVRSPPQLEASCPPALKPLLLRPPPGSASLLEKRKSLTLSLSPAGVSPPSTTDTQRPSRDTVTQRGGAPGGPQKAPRSQCGRAEVKEAGLLSPFSLTLNKLIGWGERVLLGGVFLPPVRMGQPALTYRC